MLALKSGRTRAGARAASSHTAALAGADEAAEALFRRAGVTRAASLEELLDVAALYAHGAAPRGRRVAVLTNAGGLGILCADACEAAGLELPGLGAATQAALARLLPDEASTANPVDMLGSATAERYEQALPVVLADAGVDAVIVLFVPAAAVEAERRRRRDRRCRRARPRQESRSLPRVVSAGGIPAPLRGAGSRVAAFAYPESAARALGRAAERADWLRRPAGSVPELTGIDTDEAGALVAAALGGSSDVWLGPGEVRRLLAAWGIPFVAERDAAGAEAAVEAARELGYPVVVKTAAPGVHKTEMGGVALGLTSDQEVRDAVARVGAPAVVQPLLSGNAELFAGLVQDPVFGPLVGFGPGGRLAELIAEAQFAIAPLTDVDAEELVRGGKAGRLVDGFRGAPPSDAHALAELTLRLSRLGEHLPEVAELDLNPVLGLGRGCVAVDARIRVAAAGAPSRTKTW